MSYLWAIITFVLGVVEFCGPKRVDWIFVWFAISALFTIAGNIGYGRKNNG